MVARKVSLQHKVLLGYMILIMAVCGMVSILLYERSRMREIKTETSEIRRIRHDISTAHRYITELATYGESVIVWEDTDFREYRRKRLQTDSLLQILKVSCGTFVLPKQIDSLCHLLEAKEIHLLRIMETITRQGEADSLLANRLPIVIREAVRTRTVTQKKKGIAGWFGGKRSVQVFEPSKGLTTDNITYSSPDSGKSYDFNTADTMTELLVKSLIATGELCQEQGYDLDFDHQFIETEKYDAKRTYKKFTGYSPGVAVIGDHIVGIENRDGNTNVRFCQQCTLERIFTRLEWNGIHINRARMDCGSCSEEIVDTVKAHCKYFYIRANRCSAFYEDMFALRGWKAEEINGIRFELNSIVVEKWKGKPYRLVIQRQRRADDIRELWEGEYTYRCILTNDFESDIRDVVEFYNLRGGKERILDDMNNGFGWKHLPKSFMAENAVYLLMTALIRNFYKTIIRKLNVKDFGLSISSRIKTFVFKYISVAAKWIRTSRTYVLNIYTENPAYKIAFQQDFG